MSTEGGKLLFYQSMLLLSLCLVLTFQILTHRQASIYEREGNDQQAYLLLFRHAQLVLVHLASHPEAREEAYRRPLAEAKKEVQVNLNKLESLKPRINKRYEKHAQLMRDRKIEPPSVSGAASRTSHSLHARFDPTIAGVAKPLEAGENKDLAVKLAQKEFGRRAFSRRNVPSEGSYTEFQQQSRSQGDAISSNARDRAGDADDLSLRIQEIRSRVAPQHTQPAPQEIRQNAYFQKPPNQRPSPTYNYPLVHPQSPFQAEQQFPNLDREQLQSPSPVLDIPPLQQPPPIPAKINEPFDVVDPTGPSPPPLPSKVPHLPPRPNGTPVERSNTPSADLQPSSFTFKPSAYLENGTPLRTIFISPDLRKNFLAIAEHNTRRNLETCGILCGTLMSNAFFISKLLIPEQESTSDTCEMVNEAAIFDYCDSEDLMVLGWIHTHPTQTCFMSSRDLHTQSGYQAMLAESIAIVCAPSKEPDWGVFRLTDPPGLKSVLACNQSGLFHPHAEFNIYTDALRPGHVFEAKGLAFETVDLRSR